MKCRICSFEIPEGKTSCPNCGRVIPASERLKVAQKKTGNVSDKTMVYRPASSASGTNRDETIHIPDLFSSDPNAPKYADPHSYDRATADVLEYDRMFMSRKNNSDNDITYSRPAPQPKPVMQNDEYYSDNFSDNESIVEEEEEYEDNKGSVVRDRKQAKPRFNFNIKYLILAIAVIIGLAVIVAGGYQIVTQIGLISPSGENESVASGQSVDSTKKNNNDTDNENNTYTYKTGVYTVYSEDNNIFVYKSATDQRIIATIPNKTIIEITEIEDKFGKTVYNGYSGWVRLEELKFTPNEAPEQTTEVTTEPSSQQNNTAEDFPTTPGTYTVTITNGSNELNVRSIGSTDGTIITTLKNGDEVVIEEVKSGWGKIFIDDVEGWVYMKYLK